MEDFLNSGILFCRQKAFKGGKKKKIKERDTITSCYKCNNKSNVYENSYYHRKIFSNTPEKVEELDFWNLLEPIKL